ncbi:Ribosome maturation factor RimM [Bienertia sinuspersici]
MVPPTLGKGRRSGVMPPYTWTNNRERDDLVLERLDKAYGNNGWKQTYPEAIIWNFPIFISDHGPIALDTSPQKLSGKGLIASKHGVSTKQRSPKSNSIVGKQSQMF